jgi:subtilisin family serine protease
VFFTDKGPGDEDRAQRLAGGFPAERRERLLKRSPLFRETGSLADVNDLPVFPPYIEALDAAAEADTRYASRWLNAASIRLTAEEADAVKNLSMVERLQPLRRMRLVEAVPAVPAAPPSSAEPHAASYRFDYGPSLTQSLMLRVPEAHEMGFSGSGVTICCMDTGFRTDHQALQSMNIVAEHDFVFGDGTTQNEAGDDPGQHRHGTGVVAVIGAFVPGDLIGPAYGASFLLAKTEDIRSETRVEEDNWVAGMEWADALGADVISSSLAYRYFDDGSGYSHAQLDGRTAVTTIAANMATERGIVVANAIGNEGPSSATLNAPADALRILACGAVDAEKTVADFSSRGPSGDGRVKPDLSAMGVSTRWSISGGQNSYGYANGTSLSTPLIGALAALVIEAHPDWTPYKVREALCFSACHWKAPDNSYGYGVPDVVRAILDPRGADIDASGRVDGIDLARIGHGFGATPGDDRWDPSSDLNGDGVADGVDLALFAGYFGSRFPADF